MDCTGINISYNASDTVTNCSQTAVRWWEARKFPHKRSVFSDFSNFVPLHCISLWNVVSGRKEWKGESFFVPLHQCCAAIDQSWSQDHLWKVLKPGHSFWKEALPLTVQQPIYPNSASQINSSTYTVSISFFVFIVWQPFTFTHWRGPDSMLETTTLNSLMLLHAAYTLMCQC